MKTRAPPTPRRTSDARLRKKDHRAVSRRSGISSDYRFNVRYRDGGGTGELNRKTCLPRLRRRVGVGALLVLAVFVSACGQSQGSGVGATLTAAAPAPSVATLTAIGEQ